MVWPWPKVGLARDKPVAERRRILLDSTGLPVGQQPWVGGWLLGGGAYGIAAVWMKVDPITQRITDRMVVKHLDIDNQGQAGWWDPMAWCDNIDGVGYRDYTLPINHTLPAEGVLLERLCTRAAPPMDDLANLPIIAYRGRSDVDQVNRSWKLFTEYCWWQSLAHVQDWYTDADPAQSIPEPFLWYVAEQLVLVSMVMERGSSVPANAVNNWRGIIHRDFKPENIFLTTRNRDRFQHYPRIKLADFGLAIETDRGDLANNPVNFWEDVGTDGYWSPEQRRWYQANGNLHLGKKLGPRTNVWCIGQVLRCLMGGEAEPVQPTYAIPDSLVPDIPAGSFPGYSAQLNDFMGRCLRFNYNARPTLDQCLARIHNPADNNFQGMNVAVPRAPLSMDDSPHRLDIPERDFYKVGMHRNQLPQAGQP